MVAIGIFPGVILFAISLIKRLHAPIYRDTVTGGPKPAVCGHAKKTNGAFEGSEMEKWWVILGIWALCATCAVLFIRGATGRPNRQEEDENQTQAASRASAGNTTRTALND
ncbi:hypothetical protein G3N58_22755 [Paraburkholderia sp. Ac-20342]|uniref:hypothetical protein n=1 Tax=Paraburkholderia sp. Ac-20342 TaxID=2703889 RepID=UPI00197FD1B3|nr:hypothetical protein [Paraburkholderia sp. Ac-20342]MBN3849625.1 hypothetical protein [Paraburkholderia sp. Ac-20342]